MGSTGTSDRLPGVLSIGCGKLKKQQKRDLSREQKIIEVQVERRVYRCVVAWLIEVAHSRMLLMLRLTVLASEFPCPLLPLTARVPLPLAWTEIMVG